jgi:(E)-4-hydroxy-3-methylbut-2-enyl-diphosphate synthase
MSSDSQQEYSGFHSRRFPTRLVMAGSVGIGGSQPIRIQSMVNTPPEDMERTLAQIADLAEAGSELVRLTVPTVRDAERLGHLKAALIARGVNVPLVADVHFNPQIAEICAAHVEKVRINPGNYRKPGTPAPAVWDAQAYRADLSMVEQQIVRLIGICQPHNTAVRIGSNHGSLSPRIMDRYGDTPVGMVEAALEFVRIFHKHHFHALVLSMKSSNVRVMVQAYRLLVSKMQEEGFDYPIHLGVTEAGFGEEGRIKSAAGIGMLLDEGIGDTIRVSLTEDPVEEIPVAKQILNRYRKLPSHTPKEGCQYPLPYDPFQYQRRVSRQIAGIGGSAPPVVVGYPGSVGKEEPDLIVETGLNTPLSLQMQNSEMRIPLIPLQMIETTEINPNTPYACIIPEGFVPDSPTLFSAHKHMIVVLETGLFSQPGNLRCLIAYLKQAGGDMPVILKINAGKHDYDELMVNASVTSSGLLLDGLADGIWIDTDDHKTRAAQLSFRILQATRARITAPEYISCPSCGRTRFNIQEAVVKIKARTGHLIGLKIGIMGCIVNGPGEMADADYGYVGAGNRAITLYKGKEVVKRGVHEDQAIDALVELIKHYGDWKDPDETLSLQPE